MSTLTNLLLAAGAITGVYVVGEYLPAKRRAAKRRRGAKRAPTVPAPSPTPLPDVTPEPTGPYALKPPPRPGEILQANTEAEVGAMLAELGGVPTAVLVAFSKGAVYQKVKPVFDELATTYPEVQFVESDLSAMLGTKSDVVAVDVGVDLGTASPHTGGISVLLAEGPETAEEQLKAAGEWSQPRWAVSNVDTSDMQMATSDLVLALETLIDRLELVPPTEAGFEVMPSNYRFISNEDEFAVVVGDVQDQPDRGTIFVEVVDGTPVTEMVKAAIVALAHENPALLIVEVDHGFLASQGTSKVPPSAFGHVLAGKQVDAGPRFEKVWPQGTTADQVMADLVAASETFKGTLVGEA